MPFPTQAADDTDGGASSIEFTSPTGETIEIVLLSSEPFVYAGADATEAIVLHEVDVDVTIGCTSDGCLFKIENIPLYSTDPSSDCYPFGPDASPLLCQTPTGETRSVEPMGPVIDEGFPLFLGGEGCIKISGGAAGEPIVIGSNMLFVTGPMQTGGSCS